jgi:hypothetical protein
MANITAAESATNSGVAPGTHLKQNLAWARFKNYLKSISINSNPFLENFTTFQRNKILGAFAHALRDGRFYKNKREVKAETITSTIDCMAQTYPDSIKTDNLHSFYYDKFEDTRNLTLPKNNKSL